jgi:hypothetical protein
MCLHVWRLDLTVVLAFGCPNGCGLFSFHHRTAHYWLNTRQHLVQQVYRTRELIRVGYCLYFAELESSGRTNTNRPLKTPRQRKIAIALLCCAVESCAVCLAELATASPIQEIAPRSGHANIGTPN